MAGTYTPKLHLYKPAVGEKAWGSLVNLNFDNIDAITPSDIGAEPAIGTKYSAFNKNFGQTAGTICAGDDPRLTDERPPGTHATTHGNAGGDRITIDATQITTGVIDIARIPPGAVETLKKVNTDADRFKLTTADVQNGDSVYVIQTAKMYIVVDETKLDSDDGYMVYRSYVDWSSIADKPSSFTPSAHAATHSSSGADSITPAAIGAQTKILYNTREPYTQEGNEGDVFIKYTPKS